MDSSTNEPILMIFILSYRCTKANNRSSIIFNIFFILRWSFRQSMWYIIIRNNINNNSVFVCLCFWNFWKHNVYHNDNVSSATRHPISLQWLFGLTRTHKTFIHLWLRCVAKLQHSMGVKKLKDKLSTDVCKCVLLYIYIYPEQKQKYVKRCSQKHYIAVWIHAYVCVCTIYERSNENDFLIENMSAVQNALTCYMWHTSFVKNRFYPNFPFSLSYRLRINVRIEIRPTKNESFHTFTLWVKNIHFYHNILCAYNVHIL